MEVQVLIQNEIEDANEVGKRKMYAVWKSLDDVRSKGRNYVMMGCMLVGCSQTFSDKFGEIIETINLFTEDECEQFSLFISLEMNKLT